MKHSWRYFGRLLGGFWEPKCIQKSSEILEAILEAKQGGLTDFLGHAWRNARGPREDYGGGKELILGIFFWQIWARNLLADSVNS